MILRPLFQWRPYRGEGNLATVVKSPKTGIAFMGANKTDSTTGFSLISFISFTLYKEFFVISNFSFIIVLPFSSQQLFYPK